MAGDFVQDIFRLLESYENSGSDFAAGLWARRIQGAYSEPQRHYHTLKHIERMWETLDMLEPQLDFDAYDMEVTRLAILFHE